MDRKKCMKFLVTLTIFAVVITWSTTATLAAKKYTINTLTAWPKTAFESEQFLKMAELAQKEAEQKYPGQLKIVYKGAGEVIRNREQVEACRSGLIDMVFTATSYYTSIMPEMDTFSLSPMRPWEERAVGLYDYIEKLHNQKANVHFLGRVGTGTFFYLFLARPIKVVDDLRGMKVRSSPTNIPFLKLVGAEPVSMPPPDVYTAMERGVVDGFILPPHTIRDFGLVKPSKYMVQPGIYKACQTVLINLDVWNRLPGHLQELLAKHTKNMARFAISNILKRVNSEFEAFKREGMTFIDLPPKEAEKFKKLAWDALSATIRKKAPSETETILKYFEKK
ncbi:MAG: TRAP transporter substrate-binding protein DctP [Deltaproteobacteria bacterium]|nr:TRAP transporter substrate-binding protein DctP [Deltaproteobacteria bacterium]MBW2137178.1 TRAP transporter substrate-binding protein DctP [Deltaproteobacteria bacterium]